MALGNPIGLEELNDILDNIDIGYYESGAYYDSDMERYMEDKRMEVEETYQLSVIE